MIGKCACINHKCIRLALHLFECKTTEKQYFTWFWWRFFQLNDIQGAISCSKTRFSWQPVLGCLAAFNFKIRAWKADSGKYFRVYSVMFIAIILLKKGLDLSVDLYLNITLASFHFILVWSYFSESLNTILFICIDNSESLLYHFTLVLNVFFDDNFLLWNDFNVSGGG